MSHRKFEHPRHRHLGFRSLKRAKALKPKYLGSQKDAGVSAKPHFTAMIGYKAGMTQVVRQVDRPTLKKLHNKEIVEPVTYIETPSAITVGVRGYVETPNGLKCLHTVFSQHLNEEFKRRQYKNWYMATKKAFSHYCKLYENAETKAVIDNKIEAIKTSCQVIKAIVHTQPSKIKALDMKKAHIYEVVINGGSVAEKVNFVLNQFEKEHSIKEVCNTNEMVDLVGVTTGKGHQGVVKRFGVKRLQHKTRRGARKVACIGSWTPARVSDTIARHGQMGYHHRTIKNVKIYAVKNGAEKNSGSTDFDKTVKTINPIGGFKHYGEIKNECLMLKGSVQGTARRPILIKRPCTSVNPGKLKEKIELKFIDTSSRAGHGRFQTSVEKRAVMGPLKKDMMIEA